MSKYGLRIKNIQSGSLFEVNNGVRDVLDCKTAMLTNSLFNDYMKAHGMAVWKGESTRDIICIDFKYGSKSYDEEIKHLDKTIKQTQEDISIPLDVRISKIKHINEIKEKATQNKDKYIKRTKNQLRELYYTEGVDVSWNNWTGKDQKPIKETIHYRMLYRTPGKAKTGQCMFIREELYDVAREYLYMGITLPERNAPIVEIGAYSSLVTSTIIDKIKIDPHDILILKDVDSYFKRDVVSIEIDNDKRTYATHQKDYTLKNTLFDGQALIDSSIFPEWGDGYILLRNHMCKMAAFNTNIQLFFKDYYGDDYETAELTDMFGNKHRVKDIKLITTDNACKWIKFHVSYDYWCDRVIKDNNSMFGIVKTAHRSKLGEVQQMSYQMINSLDIDLMPQIAQRSADYVASLKDGNEEFFKYLEKNKNFSNDFEVLIALCEQDPEFEYSSYFKKRKKDIIESYIKTIKVGKLINEGDNLVVVGSPYAMLLYTVGEDVEKDDTLQYEEGTIQCYTERFEDGEYLAEFRNPFNSRNNLGYMHNVYSDLIQRYFNLGKQIIAVNMIHTDAQDRNNGSDQDSDSFYVTNQPQIVDCARRFYIDYPTIVNNIPKETNSYNNTPLDFANIDNKLAASQLAIGESSNLAQICLSYSYNFKEKIYEDNVCILSVIAQASIDSAKRSYDIDLIKEIQRIKKELRISVNGLPMFWKPIKQYNDGRYIKKKKNTSGYFNEDLKCPMNYLYNHNFNVPTKRSATLPMETFFVKYPLDMSRKKSRKVEDLIEKYSWDIYAYNTSKTNDSNEDYLLLRDDFEEMIEDIKQINISKNYLGLMSWLIDRAFMISPNIQKDKTVIQSKLWKNKALLLKTLYMVNPKQLLKCFSGNILNENHNEQGNYLEQAFDL